MYILLCVCTIHKCLIVQTAIMSHREVHLDIGLVNIKQAAYSLLTYPSIEQSLYSSSKGSLQLHQLATMILESSLVYSSDSYTIGIVLHPVVGI